MEVLILLGIVMMMLNKRKVEMQTVAEIMPEVIPEIILPEPEPDLPIGTIRGPRGEGIRFQTEGRIIAALSTANPGRNPRSAGSMKFKMRIANFSDDWFRFRYQNLGRRFTDHFELVIIDPFMQRGNTPDWFKAVLSEGISKFNKDVAKVWRLIDSKIPNPTPRELSVDAIDSGSIPIIRHLKPRETSPSPIASTQLILPGIEQERTFEWGFGNDLFDDIVAGVYMAMGFVRGVDQTFSTGWMKFVVQ